MESADILIHEVCNVRTGGVAVLSCMLRCFMENVVPSQVVWGGEGGGVMGLTRSLCLYQHSQKHYSYWARVIASVSLRRRSTAGFWGAQANSEATTIVKCFL